MFNVNNKDTFLLQNIYFCHLSLLLPQLFFHFRNLFLNFQLFLLRQSFFFFSYQLSFTSTNVFFLLPETFFLLPTFFFISNFFYLHKLFFTSTVGPISAIFIPNLPYSYAFHTTPFLRIWGFRGLKNPTNSLFPKITLSATQWPTSKETCLLPGSHSVVCNGTRRSFAEKSKPTKY